MIQKGRWIVLSSILFCFSALAIDSMNSENLDLQPPNENLTVEFVTKNRESGQAMFAVSDSDNFKALYFAPHKRVHNNALKFTTTTYSSRFTYDGIEYVVTRQAISHYKPQVNGPDNKLSYQRIDNTVYEEPIKQMSQMPLDKEGYQQAFDERKLEDYCARQGIKMVPMLKHETIDQKLNLLALNALNSGLKDPLVVEQISALQQMKEQKPKDPIFGKLTEIYVENSGKSFVMLMVNFQGIWRSHVFVDQSLALERYNDRTKKKEFIKLWGMVIEGQHYVFYSESTQNYKFRTHKKTIGKLEKNHEGQKERTTYEEIYTPVYQIGGEWGGKGEEREVPQECLRVCYNCEVYEVSHEDGLLAINKGYGKEKGIYTLRLCQKTSITIKGERTMPNGDIDTVEKKSISYTLRDQPLKGENPGSWKLLNHSFGGIDLRTHVGTLPKYCCKCISNVE
ncbi:MAG: hypothetical protein KC505_02615 [Myxococcales bacterium]|nr:hypothetical protein [Myxococcales bacterium]USN51090.1 MAG: hypothetical protein H6731_01380 [Myxococcales bacterium]